MKKILTGVLMLIAVSAHAEIKTKEQADKFLDGYCIALVNEIEKAVEKQIIQVKKEEWEDFMKTGAWISGISEVYSNLCK